MQTDPHNMGREERRRCLSSGAQTEHLQIAVDKSKNGSRCRALGSVVTQPIPTL